MFMLRLHKRHCYCDVAHLIITFVHYSALRYGGFEFFAGLIFLFGAEAC